MEKVIEKWEAEIQRLQDEKSRQKKELDEIQDKREDTNDPILKRHYDLCINSRLPIFERLANKINTIQDVLNDFKDAISETSDKAKVPPQEPK